jgi:hypothetical protein
VTSDAYPWTPVDAAADPELAAVDGTALGGWRLQAFLGRPNAVGSRTFRVDLAGGPGEGLVLAGLRNRGPHAAMNWFEVANYVSGAGGTPERDLRALGLEQQLFDRLAAAVPPGGHLMIEYESPQHRETERALSLRVPPVATPLGFVLFEAGAGDWIRDWYIPEGWTEGPRKLQGFRAFDDRHRARRHAETAALLERFLATGGRDDDVLSAALGRAEALLSRLHSTA